ncbi:orotidine 5'-phosphate decarboxylase [candidate division NPL-UPA2 bacterium]|nr:orotidine 5'-phosphate decarboxylase [candidate division NPL-UPA2 bacterium]
MKPVLQLALDFVDLKRALKVAREAVEGEVDWLEAGTPLIKSEGLEAVRALRKEFPRHTLVADMKIMDAGRTEVEAAAKAGANIVDVLGAASLATIRECIEAGRNYGAEIIVDTIAVDRVSERAKEAEEMGAHYVSVHIAIDEQMLAVEPFTKLRKVAKAVNIPIAVAGGINLETAAEAVEAGASIVIVGGAISKARDARRATEEIKKAIRTRAKVKTDLYKRVSLPDVRKILQKVSTPNLSDALHRSGDLRGIRPISQGVKMVGPAVTVRTYPGDWAKPVEAIDQAEEGEVIVIDAGGVGPAVWGELATHSSRQKRLAGVIIDGAIRDTPEIRQLKFPAFARLIMPTAGEPKGLGEIGVPVRIGGVRISPGDWLVGDDDGLVAIPKEKVVEFTNRAMDVLEKENRIRKEIEEGSTLSGVTELLRWEKR